jgi:menaquinol-cytochrome c reductase iron-sulfur subunit
MEQEAAKTNEPHSPNELADAAQPAPPTDASARSRRIFLFNVALFLNGLVGTVLAIPIIGYLLGPALRKSASQNAWIDLGSAGDFPEGETRLASFRDPFSAPWDGQTAEVPCWVRRMSGNNFQVFAINCAHLGCPVRWFAQSQLFLCPCHGGVYYADGSRASGPPERGLFEYAHKVVDGKLMILAGKLPTLAAKNCGGPRLTQIQPAGATETNAATALQAPGDRSWPA